MRLVAVGLLLAACAPGQKYAYGPLGGAPARPEGCGVELLAQPPARAYDVLGILAPPDIEDGALAGGEVPFLEEVRGTVCAAGGDAVVVEKDSYGRYVRGTVVRRK